MDAQQFAELETKFKAFWRRKTRALKSASETTAASNKQLAEQMAAMQADARTSATPRSFVASDSAHPPLVRRGGEPCGGAKTPCPFWRGLAAVQGVCHPSSRRWPRRSPPRRRFRELGSDASGRPESAWAGSSAKGERAARRWSRRSASSRQPPRRFEQTRPAANIRLKQPKGDLRSWPTKDLRSNCSA